jgi:hypothetical protein
MKMFSASLRSTWWYPPPQPRLAVAIVRRPLLGIAQHVVRLGHDLELFLGVLGPVVPVGVVLHRQLAICLLDLVVGRAARDAEDRVEIRHTSG